MQQVQQHPGGPVPYSGAYTQPRPKGTFFTIFVVIAVILIIIVGVALGTVYYLAKSTSGPNTIKVTAYQYYVGDLNRTLLFKVLKNDSYDPVSNSPTYSSIGFKPYCGDPGSDQANSTRTLFMSAYFTLNGDNTTIKLVTRDKGNTETNRNMLEDSTNCAFDKLATIMKDDINMSLVNQNIDMKKFTTPGFEAVVVLSAVVIAVAFYKYKKVPR